MCDRIVVLLFPICGKGGTITLEIDKQPIQLHKPAHALTVEAILEYVRITFDLNTKTTTHQSASSTSNQSSSSPHLSSSSSPLPTVFPSSDPSSSIFVLVSNHADPSVSSSSTAHLATIQKLNDWTTEGQTLQRLEEAFASVVPPSAPIQHLSGTLMISSLQHCIDMLTQPIPSSTASQSISKTSSIGLRTRIILLLQHQDGVPLDSIRTSKQQLINISNELNQLVQQQYELQQKLKLTQQQMMEEAIEKAASVVAAMGETSEEAKVAMEAVREAQRVLEEQMVYIEQCQLTIVRLGESVSPSVITTAQELTHHIYRLPLPPPSFSSSSPSSCSGSSFPSSSSSCSAIFRLSTHSLYCPISDLSLTFSYLVQQHLNLNSIKITGIPMKQTKTNQNQQSTNYDVILLYKNSEKEGECGIEEKVMIQDRKDRMIRETIENERQPKSLICTIAQQFISRRQLSLHWTRAPSNLPKHSLPCRCLHSITPLHSLSNPTICLIKHVLSDKPATLTKKGDGGTTHVLLKHDNGLVYLHCLHTKGTMSCLAPPTTAAGKKAQTMYTIPGGGLTIPASIYNLLPPASSDMSATILSESSSCTPPPPTISTKHLRISEFIDEINLHLLTHTFHPTLATEADRQLYFPKTLLSGQDTPTSTSLEHVARHFPLTQHASLLWDKSYPHLSNTILFTLLLLSHAYMPSTVSTISTTPSSSSPLAPRYVRYISSSLAALSNFTLTNKRDLFDRLKPTSSSSSSNTSSTSGFKLCTSVESWQFYRRLWEELHSWMELYRNESSLHSHIYTIIKQMNSMVSEMEMPPSSEEDGGAGIGGQSLVSKESDQMLSKRMEIQAAWKALGGFEERKDRTREKTKEKEKEEREKEKDRGRQEDQGGSSEKSISNASNSVENSSSSSKKRSYRDEDESANKDKLPSSSSSSTGSASSITSTSASSSSSLNVLPTTTVTATGSGIKRKKRESQLQPSLPSTDISKSTLDPPSALPTDDRRRDREEKQRDKEKDRERGRDRDRDRNRNRHRNAERDAATVSDQQDRDKKPTAASATASTIASTTASEVMEEEGSRERGDRGGRGHRERRRDRDRDRDRHRNRDRDRDGEREKDQSRAGGRGNRREGGMELDGTSKSGSGGNTVVIDQELTLNIDVLTDAEPSSLFYQYWKAERKRGNDRPDFAGRISGEYNW